MVNQVWFSWLRMVKCTEDLMDDVYGNLRNMPWILFVASTAKTNSYEYDDPRIGDLVTKAIRQLWCAPKHIVWPQSLDICVYTYTYTYRTQAAIDSAGTTPSTCKRSPFWITMAVQPISPWRNIWQRVPKVPPQSTPRADAQSRSCKVEVVSGLVQEWCTPWYTQIQPFIKLRIWGYFSRVIPDVWAKPK